VYSRSQIGVRVPSVSKITNIQRGEWRRRQAQALPDHHGVGNLPSMRRTLALRPSHMRRRSR